MISARKLAVLKGFLAGPCSGAKSARPRGTWRLHATVLFSAFPLIALTGCFHHQPPPPPPVASGPPALPGSMTTIPAVPPKMPDPGKPDVALTDPKPAPVVVPPTHTHRAVRKKRVPDGNAPPAPATAATAAPAAPSASGAAAPAESSAPAVPAAAKAPELGQLSAGNSADSKELSSMIEQIHTLEMRLANLKHSQNSDEEATQVQIRLFLAKARQATVSNDLDGARTLALKAKVLLDELTNL